MSIISTLRTQLAIPPLPIYFLGLSVSFACILVFLRQVVVSDSNFGIMEGLLVGCIFGAVMASSVAVSRYRLKRAVGISLSPEQVLRLDWSMDHLILPQDPHLRQVFPHYLRHLYILNQHSRMYIPLFLGSLTIGSIILYVHTTEALWLLYAGLFAALGCIGVRGINRSLRTIRLLTPRLQAVPHRQQKPEPTRQHIQFVAPHTI